MSSRVSTHHTPISFRMSSLTSASTSSLASGLPAISAQQREQHVQWLAEVTSIPSAAGREQRVVAWLERFVAERPAWSMSKDPAGNLVVERANSTSHSASSRPIFITAHLDHPAFVIERVISPSVFEVSFRGGVMDEYFQSARVVAYDNTDQQHRGVLTGTMPGPDNGQAGPFKHYLFELDRATDALNIGDVAVWDLGPAQVINNQMHTLACDDLSAVAAMACLLDVLQHVEPTQDVRFLFTRAEEVGFIGAIATIRHGTMPKNSRVIALENSRAFPESPIHGGPIVRVGDRMSVFSPVLTDAIAKRAEEIAGAPSTVTASQKLSNLPQWKWQRKLMAGGACEASVYFNAGYEATCVCLPLGNYHNMADLAAVQANTNTTPPKVGREFIGIDDYHALIDLLIGCAVKLPESGKKGELFEKLWNERNFVLG